MCHAHFKQSHIHTCVYTHLTYMCPYIDTYIYIHIYIFIYIYMYVKPGIHNPFQVGGDLPLWGPTVNQKLIDTMNARPTID